MTVFMTSYHFKFWRGPGGGGGGGGRGDPSAYETLTGIWLQFVCIVLCSDFEKISGRSTILPTSKLKLKSFSLTKTTVGDLAVLIVS